jgi:hypothetical protein
MGWSSEVHARRILQIREKKQKEREAGKYELPPIKGNSSVAPIVAATG